MPDIDLVTLTSLTFAINAIVAGYMLLLARLNIAQPAFYHWAASCIIFIFASLLAVSRMYQVTPVISVWLAHSLLALPPILIATGLLRFFRGTETPLPIKKLGIIFAAYATLLFFTYKLSYSAPILTATAIALGCCWCIALLNLNTTQRVVSKLLQGVLLLHALAMVAEITLYIDNWQLPLTRHSELYLEFILISHLLLTTIASMMLPLLLFVHREQHLMLQANRDELTHLPNRRHFLRESSTFMARATDSSPVIIMMLDLDNFKSINDTFGHAVGDAALKQVADALNIELRATDLIGRMGGEEFAIVMTETTEAAARKVAERLRQKVELQARVIEGNQINLTISIGAICSYKNNSSDFQALLKLADDALFEAKRRGRNQIIFDYSTNDAQVVG
ncbi:GGDEF domain-containing protein [Halopseudomonas laoshanensis]|uniref:diguanylate cyclase n=1 Tax=Halopseudomonas laoshanensis TaxID=2268758 RepID=A0A7V7GVZ7_9GAMM|nr:GGDEF domain-containing protein [Halopseudomonas laoshanensis]KAA0696337.1 GGDEF domain-containing protein [Halopseudomonas laoshanensis]